LKHLSHEHDNHHGIPAHVNKPFLEMGHYFHNRLSDDPIVIAKIFEGVSPAAFGYKELTLFSQ